MAAKMASSFSCVSTCFSSPFQPRRSSKVSLASRSYGCVQLGRKQPKIVKVQAVSYCCSLHGRLNSKERFTKRRFMFFASTDDLMSDIEIEVDGTEQEDDGFLVEDDGFLVKDVPSEIGEAIDRGGGRPGLVSFYNHPYRKESEILMPINRKQNNLLWFAGPAVLVSSFIFPSLYMRRILSTILEDSLLTDFLILFFTEALFYWGVAVFLLIVDHLRRPIEPVDARSSVNSAPKFVYRITSVAILVLSLVVPMVTMGLVWPWTGPAASATLAPYLVGIVVQFAFEQYARRIKSPSWPVIPVIFQVYRLHQLNRAAQLVTALSFTVKGAEMTPHNLAINSSLGTLLNVLQFLGVICIWSLSSFLMRFLPSATITEQ